MAPASFTQESRAVGPALALFVGESELLLLEAAWRSAQADTDTKTCAPAQLALAWGLRQRDARRCKTLIESLRTGFAAAPPLGQRVPAAYAAYAARLLLIEAELALIQGELAAASEQGERALRDFAKVDDALGEADAHWLLACVAQEMGLMQRHSAELEWMGWAAAAGADSMRQNIAKVGRARAAALQDLALGEAMWRVFLDASELGQTAAELAHQEDFNALLATLKGDYFLAAAHFAACYEQALNSGQLTLMVQAALNTASSCLQVNDPHSALEWAQLGLELARQQGLSGGEARALALAGVSLCYVRPEPLAHDELSGALGLLAQRSNSGPYAAALGQLGDLQLFERQAGSALQSFRELEWRALALAEQALLRAAWIGQAKALLALADPAAAIALMQALLQSEGASPINRIAALHLIADAHRADARIAAPPSMTAASPALHYLLAALELAAAMPACSLLPALLSALARAFADAGDLAKAFDYELQANQAGKWLRGKIADQLSLALHHRRESRLTQANIEMQQQALEDETARAELWQAANQTLERLGAIGRDIVGDLNQSAVCVSLHRHVLTLLDAAVFALYRLQPDGQTLERVFGVGDGEHMGSKFASADSATARCARERCEIVLNLEVEVEGGDGPVPAGGQEVLSMMFSPLLLGERLLGVLTIQSPRPHAYGERELAILQSLSAFTAIGLANAEVLERLRSAQAQGIQQEKMVALGQLVAHVAKEINTPMAAIKVNGRSIARALAHVLGQFPPLLRRLDGDVQDLYIRLIERAGMAAPIDSQAEYSQVSRLAARLSLAGVAEPNKVAGMLVPMGTLRDAENREELKALLPLLRHRELGLILDSARQLAGILKSAGKINAAVDQVAKIVSTLKTYAYVDKRAERLATNLSQSLQAALAPFGAEFKQAGIELVCRFEDLAAVMAWPDDLHQVWTQLIRNAVQAMRQPGRLRIELSRSKGHAVVAVIDSGCGIPAEQLGRIVEPFFSPAPGGGGACGLGLTIVKKIIDKHHGRVEVESTIGKGSRFTVYLPYTFRENG